MGADSQTQPSIRETEFVFMINTSDVEGLAAAAAAAVAEAVAKVVLVVVIRVIAGSVGFGLVTGLTDDKVHLTPGLFGLVTGKRNVWPQGDRPQSQAIPVLLGD